MKKIGKYGISQELEDKINKEYDELFGSDQSKLGFMEVMETPKNDWFEEGAIHNYKPSWNAAIEAALKAIELDQTDAYENVRKLKK